MASSIPHDSNEEKTVALCIARIATLADYVDGAHPIMIDGTAYTLAEAQAKYQAPLDARARLGKQRTEVAAKIRAREAADAAVAEIEKGLRAWVLATFGAKSKAATDFGFTKKRAVPSAETQARAAEKRRATRAARGTKAKKARAKT